MQIFAEQTLLACGTHTRVFVRVRARVGVLRAQEQLAGATRR